MIRICVAWLRLESVCFTAIRVQKHGPKRAAPVLQGLRRGPRFASNQVAIEQQVMVNVYAEQPAPELGEQ